MRAVFDKTGLETLLQDFYALTGLRTVVFDVWGMDILSYPKELPMYCRLIHMKPDLGRPRPLQHPVEHVEDAVR